jgi:hypothetical protein
MFALTGAWSPVAGGTIPGLSGPIDVALGSKVRVTQPTESDRPVKVLVELVFDTATDGSRPAAEPRPADASGDGDGLPGLTRDPPYPGRSFPAGLTLPADGPGGTRLTLDPWSGASMGPDPLIGPEPDSSGRASAGAAVPEPTGLAIVLSGVFCLAGRAAVGRRRRGGA